MSLRSVTYMCTNTHTHTHTHTLRQIISHHLQESSEIPHSKIKAAKILDIGQRLKIKHDLIVRNYKRDSKSINKR